MTRRDPIADTDATATGRAFGSDPGYAPGRRASTADDRELRCEDCSTRIFSARAAKLHRSGFRCPRCGGRTSLVPA
jgi:DNA-directed RNA polymerase subunit RPC12/RpoP